MIMPMRTGNTTTFLYIPSGHSTAKKGENTEETTATADVTPCTPLSSPGCFIAYSVLAVPVITLILVVSWAVGSNKER